MINAKNVGSMQKMAASGGQSMVLREYTDVVLDQTSGKKTKVSKPIVSIEDMFKHDKVGALLKRLLPLAKYRGIINTLQKAFRQTGVSVVNLVTGTDHSIPALTEAILRAAFPPGTTYKPPGESDIYNAGYQYHCANWGSQASDYLERLLFGHRKAPSQKQLENLIALTEKYEELKGTNPDKAAEIEALISEMSIHPSETVTENSNIARLLQENNAATYRSNPEQFADDIEKLNHTDFRKSYEVYQREVEKLQQLTEAIHRPKLPKKSKDPDEIRMEEVLSSRRMAQVGRQRELVEELGARFNFEPPNPYQPVDYINRSGGFVHGQSGRYFELYQTYINQILTPARLDATARSMGKQMSMNEEKYQSDNVYKNTIMLNVLRVIISEKIMPLLLILQTVDPNPVPGYEQYCIKNIVNELKSFFLVILRPRVKVDDWFTHQEKVLRLTALIHERLRRTSNALIIQGADKSSHMTREVDAAHGGLNTEGTTRPEKDVAPPRYEFLAPDLIEAFNDNRPQNNVLVFVSENKITFNHPSATPTSVQYVEMDQYPVDEQEAEELIQYVVEQMHLDRPVVMQEDVSTSPDEDKDVVLDIGRSLLRKIKPFLVGHGVSVALKILTKALSEAETPYGGLDKSKFYAECVKQSRSVANNVKGVFNAVTTDPEDAVTLDPKSYIRDFTGSWGGEVERIRVKLSKYMQRQMLADQLYDVYDDKSRLLKQTTDDEARKSLQAEMDDLQKRAVQCEQEADAALQKIPSLTVLYGDPASGKSIFPEAIANALGFNYMILDFGQAKGGLVGQTEHRTLELLNTIKNMYNTIFLIDELDGQAFGTGQRTGFNESESGQLKMMQTFFADNDKIMQQRRVKCIGTTNNPEALGSAMASRASMKEVQFNMTPSNVYKILTSTAQHMRRHYTIPPGDLKDWDAVESFVTNLGEETLRKISNELSKKHMDFRQLIRWVQEAFGSQEAYVDQQEVNNAFYADKTPDKARFRDEYLPYYNMWKEQVYAGLIGPSQPPRLTGAIPLTAENMLLAAKKTSVEETPPDRNRGGAPIREVKDGFSVMTTEAYVDFINQAQPEDSIEQMELPLEGLAEPLIEDDDMVEPVGLPPATPPKIDDYHQVDEDEDEDDVDANVDIAESPKSIMSSTDYFFNALSNAGNANHKPIGKIAIQSPNASHIDAGMVAPTISHPTMGVSPTKPVAVDNRLQKRYDTQGVSIIPAYSSR